MGSRPGQSAVPTTHTRALTCGTQGKRGECRAAGYRFCFPAVWGGGGAVFSERSENVGLGFESLRFVVKCAML
jgi:hypothetical protein